MIARILILFSMLSSLAFAQAQIQTQTQTQPQPAAIPPGTEIYLVDLTVSGGNLTAAAPKNITQRKGYDNQPYFTPDGQQILYTSFREIQTDIYRYNIASGKQDRITSTPESEFSPTVMPDRTNMSVVRVEPGQVQRLWRFSLTGGKPELLLEEIQPVGYHAWVDDTILGLFVLGNPNTLQIADVSSGASTVVTKSIGRSIHHIPGGNEISFTQKVAEEWFIKGFDVESGETKPITKALPSQEHDYAWMPDRTLLMADGSKLYKQKPGTDKDWVLVADFASNGIKGITRIGVSPDGKRIAFVADE